MFVNFEKWNACGNDFILVKRPLREKPEWEDIFKRNAKALCSRAGNGVGADGILLLSSSPDEIHLSIVNSDGSLAQNCGNGIRAAASSLFLENDQKTNEELEGCAFFIEGRTVSVQFLPKSGDKIPWAVATMPNATDCSAEYSALLTNFPNSNVIDIGNRHLVIFLDGDLPSLEKIDADSLNIQKQFPELNVMWAVEQVHRSQDNAGFKIESAFRAIPFERGVGRTGSCGSGSCAIVQAHVLQGFSDRNKWSIVHMPGGALYVSHNNPHQLSGGCRRTFTGEIDL